MNVFLWLLGLAVVLGLPWSRVVTAKTPDLTVSRVREAAAATVAVLVIAALIAGANALHVDFLRGDG